MVKKHFANIIILLVLSTLLTTSAFAEENTDKDNYSEDKTKITENLSQKNNIQGYDLEILSVLEKGFVTQTPTAEANKCEVLQIMARSFRWTLQENASTQFTDVPEWCQQLAATAFSQGIVEGRTSTQLGLDSPVSRFEVAVMLHRELKRRNYQFTGTNNVEFSDTIVDWATEAVNALSAESIIRGFQDKTFGGTKGILKQDLGIMLLRLEKPSDKIEETKPEFIDQELVNSWTYQSTTLEDETILEATDANKEFVITFDDSGRLSVSGDCNSIAGSYSVTPEKTLSFGALAMTKMFCENSIETEFSQQLTSANSYLINDNNLTINFTLEQKNGTMLFTR